MSVYALWNNKGGVGKSYLTFQIASEYAMEHPEKKVLVLDLCPQANASSMILGGVELGEYHLSKIHDSSRNQDTSGKNDKKTISSYIEERIKSPYINSKTGANFYISPNRYNPHLPKNLYLVPGDEQLEVQASRVISATTPGPTDAWRLVHIWISDLIEDIKFSLDSDDLTVFIDCNPSFSIYTELALSASDYLLIPFSADGASKRAVRAVLALVYGITRYKGQQLSEFHINSKRYRMSVPKIYSYIGNRLTQMNQASASAFRIVVNDIGDEIYEAWLQHPNLFAIHPAGTISPHSKKSFRNMFHYEINDANTASVVSGAEGIPISQLTSGNKIILGKKTQVSQSQLDKQVPNIQNLIRSIE